MLSVVSEQTSRPTTEAERLTGLPPSAKLVAKTLEYEGRLTQSQLADQTRLPKRTVRYALGELRDRNLVTSSVYFADARKRLYELSTPEHEDAAADAHAPSD